MRTQQAVVIGAGIGGLVAALDLARAGFAVTMLEAAAEVGGKVRQAGGSARIDAGPTVLTMRDVFEQIFDDAGDSLDRRLALRPAEVLARHAWNGHARLDLFADPARSADAIGQFAGAAEARGYHAFRARAAEIFAILDNSFLRAQRPSMAQLMGRAGVAPLLRINPFSTLASALDGFFRDPRLRQLYGRYATYCGSSPTRCPATLMLVAHVEQKGVWLVEGGMRRLVTALAALAASAGVAVRTGSRVAAVVVEAGRAAGVTLAGGERLDADIVLCNADAQAIASGAFGAACQGAVAPMPRRARSLSAMTWAIEAETHGFPLERHNVFFSEAPNSEFGEIFGRAALPSRPTVYVCGQDRGDGRDVVGGAERLLCLTNAPATGDRHHFSSAEIEQCETRMSAALARCGLSLGTPRLKVVTTPTDFASLFPATGGALYGPASHGWMASFQRPAARSRLAGLYLAGGSVHPAPGLPMAALSGRLAAACAIADRASTPRWRRTAMSGGMSTPSARTDAKASP